MSWHIWDKRWRKQERSGNSGRSSEGYDITLTLHNIVRCKKSMRGERDKKTVLFSPICSFPFQFPPREQALGPFFSPSSTSKQPCGDVLFAEGILTLPHGGFYNSSASTSPSWMESSDTTLYWRKVSSCCHHRRSQAHVHPTTRAQPVRLVLEGRCLQLEPHQWVSPNFVEFS